MKFGLSDSVVEKIQNIFAENARVDKAIVFGSRAKGNYKEGSDIDIAIKGQDLNFDDTLSLLRKLDELELPYEIDLINYHTINEPDLKNHIDRVGIEIYSRWKEYKFSELLVDDSISYGIVQPGSHTEINSVPIIRVNNIKNGYIKTDEVMKVSYSIEENYKRTRLIGGELLITVVGSVGECAIVPDNLKGWNVARAVSVARIKNGFDKKFIKYAFKTDDIIFQMYGSTNDTVQPTLNLSSLKELKFKVPSLTEQTAIAAILSSLDDKIALLHRQNKTLEQLAETLFRQWFVEEAEESISLGELAKVSTGKGLKRSEFVENGTYPILGANGEIGRTNNYLTEEKLILTGRVGTLGEVKISSEKVWISDNVLIINPNEGKFFYPIYFSLSRIDFENMNVGSTQPLVTQTDLKKIELKLPSDIKIEKFAEDCNLYFNKINNNQTQIRTLTQTRDTLLPKLMSGEVRVSEL